MKLKTNARFPFVQCLESAADGIRLSARIVDTPCNEMNTDIFIEVSSQGSIPIEWLSSCRGRFRAGIHVDPWTGAMQIRGVKEPTSPDLLNLQNGLEDLTGTFLFPYNPYCVEESIHFSS